MKNQKFLSFFFILFLFFQISLAKTQPIYLNLKDVPLKDFIYTVSKTLKINVNIPENLRGKITFVSNSPLSKDELFLIFVNILKERNLALKKIGKKTYLITYKRNVRIYPKYSILILNFENRNLANSFYQVARNFLAPGENVKLIFNTVILYVEDNKKKFFLQMYKKFYQKENLLEKYKLYTLKIKDINEIILRNLANKYFSIFGERNYFLGYDRKNRLVILFAPKKYGEKFFEILKNLNTKVFNQTNKNDISDFHIIKLKYAKVENIEKVLKKLFLKDRDIIITSLPSENYLIIYAPSEKYNEIKNIVNSIDNRKPLVAIETQIVELSLNKEKNFSLQASFDTSLNKDNKLAFGLIFPSSDSLAITPAPGINIGILDINSNVLKALLNAYKSQGLATILSSPNILTLSGDKATIEVSKVIPFQTGQKYDSNGNPIITYEYKDVGLKLEIIPYVKNKNYVLLKIKQDVSDVTGYASSQTLPITAKKSIDTEILVKSGQTIVIGGIKSRKVLKQENKVPILSDIPLLGNLFKKEIKTYEDTNLMIFISPKILYNDEDVDIYTNYESKSISIRKVKSILKNVK